MESGNSREGRGRAVGGSGWLRKRSRSRCQTSYSYSPLFLSTFLHVPLVIIFPIEGLDASILSPKKNPGFFGGVLSFKSESVSSRHLLK